MLCVCVGVDRLVLFSEVAVGVGVVGREEGATDALHLTH